MEKTNHTPGPWQIENDSIIGNMDGGYGDDGSQTRHDVICLMQDEYLDQLDNWKDNARLIAAAPELLEALEGFVNDIDAHPSIAAQEHYMPFMAMAKSAINKAKRL